MKGLGAAANPARRPLERRPIGEKKRGPCGLLPRRQAGPSPLVFVKGEQNARVSRGPLNTSGSLAPGAAVLSQTRSWWRIPSIATAAGSSRWRETAFFKLRSGIPSPNSAYPEHRRDRHYILVGHSRVVRKDIRFAPPSAIKPMTNSTEGRVPRTTGLPARTSGSSVMREVSIVTGPAPPFDSAGLYLEAQRDATSLYD